MTSKWPAKTVEELVASGALAKPLDGNHGAIHPKTSDFVPEGVPFIMASDLSAGRVNLDSCNFITEEQASSLRKGFSKTGDVLISHKATIGRTAIVQESEYPRIVLTPQVTYYRILDPTQISAEYLKYYFDSPGFQHLLSVWAGAGSTRAYLGITAQMKLPIVCPPIAIQDAIANAVRPLNDKIELNRRLNRTLESMAQAIFKSWFVDFEPVKAKAVAKSKWEAKNSGQSIDSAAKALAQVERAAMATIAGIQESELDQLPEPQQQSLAHTAALFPDSFQGSELGEIPKWWTAKPLYDTATFINGAVFNSKDFSSTGDGLPIVKIAELKSGITQQTKFTTDTFPEKVKIGDDQILYSWSGSPKTSLEVFRWFGGDGWLNQHIFRICTESVAQKYFVFYLLRQLKPRLISIATDKQTTGLGHVTVADMKRLLVAYPDDGLLARFGDIIHPIYEAVSNNEKQNGVLANLRDTFLPKLLSGEISTDPVHHE